MRVGTQHTASTKATIGAAMRAVAERKRAAGIVMRHSPETRAKMSVGIRRAIAEGKCGKTDHLREWRRSHHERWHDICSLGGQAIASKTPRDVAALRKRYSDFGVRSRRRGWLFDLTTEQFRLLLLSDCHYCGSQPGQVQRKHGEHILFQGIDRIDSAHGYVQGNVVACCVDCNRAKNTLSHTEFIRLVHAIASRHP